MKSVPAPDAAPLTPPGQGQVVKSLQASQMAHAAAQRAAVSRVLAKGSTARASHNIAASPKPTGYKAHVLAVAGMPNGTLGDVHGAIDMAAQAGAFSPDQATALKAHNGPLMGQAGAHTIATLGTTLASMKGS